PPLAGPRTAPKRPGDRTSQEKTMARPLHNAVKRGLGVLVAALFTATAAQAADVVVGSKIDTEGGILGNVIVQVLKSHGLTVQNRVGLGATPINRKALL